MHHQSSMMMDRKLFLLSFLLSAVPSAISVPQANVTVLEIRNSTSSIYSSPLPVPSTTMKPVVLASGSLSSSNEKVFAKRSGETRSSRDSTDSTAESRRNEDALETLTAKESMEILQTMILGGKPGVDFPNYGRPPRTKFSCRKMEYGGMFADPETGCQAYHVCYNRRKDTFLCPTGTLFNQQIMACDFWYNVNCGTATQYYDMNVQLYHPYQVRGVATPETPRAAPSSRPSVNRSDRPIAENPALNPIPATSGPKPVFEVSPSARTSQIPPNATRKPTMVTIITLASTTSPTTSTTTASPQPVFTYSATTEPSTPRTKKPTTSRVRIVTVPRSRWGSSRTTPRPPPPGIEVDDRDWVFAWLQSSNGTRADKGVLPENAVGVTYTTGTQRMTQENYPLLSLTGLETDKRKTETAFSFNQDIDHKSETPFDFSHRTGSVSPESRISSSSSAFDQRANMNPYNILIKRRESELRGETVSHPSPWLFPIETESSRT